MHALKTSLAAAACMVAVTTLGSPAEAGRGWGRGKGPGRGQGFMQAELIGQMAAELGVGEGTLAQIRDLTYKANKKLVDLKADVQRARVELHHQLSADAPDTAVVMGLVEQLGAKETLLHKNRVGLLLSVRKLLTPEQRAKLQSLLANRWAESGRRRGPPGPGQPMPGTGGWSPPGGGPGPGARQGSCPGPGPCGY